MALGNQSCFSNEKARRARTHQVKVWSCGGDKCWCGDFVSWIQSLLGTEEAFETSVASLSAPRHKKTLKVD